MSKTSFKEVFTVAGEIIRIGDFSTLYVRVTNAVEVPIRSMLFKAQWQLLRTDMSLEIRCTTWYIKKPFFRSMVDLKSLYDLIAEYVLASTN